MYYLKSLVIITLILLTSCNSLMTNEEFSNEEIKYIRELGILDSTEKIILFDSQAGFMGIEAAGNFFTNKRIASYWIDKDRKDQTKINFAYYEEIDSIKTKDLTKAPTYSSFLEIYKKNGKSFKVYVDEDSLGTWNFFNKAVSEWNKNKK